VAPEPSLEPIRCGIRPGSNGRRHIFRGEGTNHEGEPFMGHLHVQPLVEGTTAVMLTYLATLHEGSVVHEEAALLGRQQDGSLCLWPVMSEWPAVLPHPQKSTAAAGQEGRFVFACGARCHHPLRWPIAIPATAPQLELR
jgi:hypothetical protein